MHLIFIVCLAARRLVGCILKASISSASQKGEYILEGNTKGMHQTTLLFLLCFVLSHAVFDCDMSY